MSHRFFTLIIVPHAKARFRKIQVPVRLAKWTAGALTASGLVIAAMLGHYFWIRVEIGELRRLQVENKILTQQARDYELNVGRLKAKGIAFDLRRLPGYHTWQLFFVDPNGAKVEIDFDPAEAAPA